jgi:hypothetical protein
MNQGTDSILSVYSDARTEYTKQLCIFLVPAFFKFFIDLLERSKQNTTLEPKKTLWQFQTYLNEIHDWNMEKVTNEINIIYNNCGCDYLDDLLTAVFIAHTKVLTAIRISGNNKKVQITVPKVEHFLFRVLCESSKLLWSSAFLFRDGISGIEKQQNYRNIEQLLNEGILQAIRGLVPVKSILKDFVNNDANDDSDSDSDSDELENKKIKQDNSISEHLPHNIDSINNIVSEISSDIDNTHIHKSSEHLLSDQIQSNSLNQEVNETTQESLQPEPSLQSESLEPASLEPESLQQHNNELMENNQETHHLQELQQPQMIYVEDKPSVQFADFNAILDSDNPNNSDLVFDDRDDNDSPDLEILDDVGIPLTDDIGFDNIDDI